jgi:hypothetical protein
MILGIPINGSLKILCSLLPEMTNPFYSKNITKLKVLCKLAKNLLPENHPLSLTI